MRFPIKLTQATISARKYDEAINQIATISQRYEKAQADAAAEAQAKGQAFQPMGIFQRYPELAEAFVNAAAGAVNPLGSPQEDMALALYERDKSLSKKDTAGYLARLGWVLSKVRQYEKSTALLRRALSIDDHSEVIRRQLVGVYVKMADIENSNGAVEKAKEYLASAKELLQGKENNVETKMLMADIYINNKNYPEAIEIFEQILRDDPKDVDARLMLARVLSWKRPNQKPEDFARSLSLLRELEQEALTQDAIQKEIAEKRMASDKVVLSKEEYQELIAEVTLWSGNAKEALVLYERMLTNDNFAKRPWLWWGFVDAAAADKTQELAPAQLQILEAIAQATLKDEHRGSATTRIFAAQSKAQERDGVSLPIGLVASVPRQRRQGRGDRQQNPR